VTQSNVKSPFHLRTEGTAGLLDTIVDPSVRLTGFDKLSYPDPLLIKEGTAVFEVKKTQPMNKAVFVVTRLDEKGGEYSFITSRATGGLFVKFERPGHFLVRSATAFIAANTCQCCTMKALATTSRYPRYLEMIEEQLLTWKVKGIGLCHRFWNIRACAEKPTLSLPAQLAVWCSNKVKQRHISPMQPPREKTIANEEEFGKQQFALWDKWAQYPGLTEQSVSCC
jgi:hypothetical protein